jgi:cytochrome c-type biogenesis protein CcmF
VQALGYSFQFNGLDQLPDGKYAMQVVAKRGNETFLSTPKLLPTDQGMVRNPDIHKYLTEDLYVSPGDYDPGKAAGDLLQLQKGESKDSAGYSVKFVDYVRAGHETTTQTQTISVGAILEVTKNGVTTIITPTVSTDAQRGLVSNPVTLPGTTMEFALDTPQVGQAIISVLNTADATTATPPFITLEISREPGINLLWAGLIIIALGVAVAVVRRRMEEQRALPVLAAAEVAQPVAVARKATPKKAGGKQGVPQPSRAGRIP